MKLNRCRRGVSTVLGGIIVAAIVFTTGTGFIIFNMNTQHQYDQRVLESKAETLLLRTGNDTAGHITFNATNIGSVTAFITAYFTFNSTDFSAVVNIASGNIGLNTGTVSPNVATAVKSNGCTQQVPCAVTVVTTRGNRFSQTFPMPLTGCVNCNNTSTSTTISQTTINQNQCITLVNCPFSLVSQGLGFIAMDFNYMKAYLVSCPNKITPENDTTAKQCVIVNPAFDTASQYSGYSIDHSSVGSNYILFALNLTNADSKFRTIVLNPSSSGSKSPSGSVLVQFAVPPNGGGQTGSVPFVLGNVCTVPAGCSGFNYGATMPATSVMLPPCALTGTPPNQRINCTPKIVFFYAQNPGYLFGSSLGNPLLTANFLYLYGTIGSNTFGQALPFTTTLYT